MKKHQPVNWNPYWTNPIDEIEGRTEKQYFTPIGAPVRITKPGSDFVIYIGQERIETGDNLQTCYYLNRMEVGLLV